MRDCDRLAECAIWLLGDSNPSGWENDLEVPRDKRFPTRHNIWTPILDELQRHAFLACRGRLRDNAFYVRNAVEDVEDKGETENCAKKIVDFGRLMEQKRPILVLCFGQFAYEFARRAQGLEKKRWKHWSVERLAIHFGDAVQKFDPNKVNLFPLLHAVVAQKFAHCHSVFSGGRGNYFEYVGQEFARLLVEHRMHPRLELL